MLGEVHIFKQSFYISALEQARVLILGKYVLLRVINTILDMDYVSALTQAVLIWSNICRILKIFVVDILRTGCIYCSITILMWHHLWRALE